MAMCPSGHASVATDYCDVCGERIGGPPPSTTGGSASSGTYAVPHVEGPGTPGAPGGSGTSATACPDCGTPKTDRFCEECGYDFAIGGDQSAPPPPAPPSPAPAPEPAPAHTPTPAPAPRPVPEAAPEAAPRGAEPAEGSGWVAVVNADRDYYEAVIAELEPDAGVIAFPPYCPERRVPIGGEQVRIGRASPSRGVTPEIDLRVPPEDPGVSHMHAVLLARPGGDGWTLVDPGSRNGTCVNGSTATIPVNTEVPVGDGDRIHVGVWTTITLRKDAS